MKIADRAHFNLEHQFKIQYFTNSIQNAENHVRILTDRILDKNVKFLKICSNLINIFTIFDRDRPTMHLPLLWQVSQFPENTISECLPPL